MKAAQPAIEDYAIIGDCRTAALVSREGSIDWLCLPHFSGPSVFAALLDPARGGRFSIRPEQPFGARRRYVGATPVLETTFETPTGTARLVDLMPVTENAGGLYPMREVLRIVEGIEGEVELRFRFEPRPNYARAAPRFRSRGALGWACTWSDELFLLRAEAPMELAPNGAAVVGGVRARPGKGSASRSPTPKPRSARSRRSASPPRNAGARPSRGGRNGAGDAPMTGRIGRPCCAAP
jgi:hypothetical protein